MTLIIPKIARIEKRKPGRPKGTFGKGRKKVVVGDQQWVTVRLRIATCNKLKEISPDQSYESTINDLIAKATTTKK